MRLVLLTTCSVTCLLASCGGGGTAVCVGDCDTRSEENSPRGDGAGSDALLPSDVSPWSDCFGCADGKDARAEGTSSEWRAPDMQEDADGGAGELSVETAGGDGLADLPPPPEVTEETFEDGPGLDQQPGETQVQDGSDAVPCIPDCAGKGCGADGCGGVCGICSDDGNPCTDEICDWGVCQHMPNAAPCNDWNACTQADQCTGGGCLGQPLPLDACDDGLPCTDDACVPVTGCVHVNNGLPCFEPQTVHVFVDVVVAGAGSGGTSAAIEAARHGMKVALLEETDWVGGQMTAAAVTSMDEGYKNRDSGIYKEFIDQVKQHYGALGKSIGTCYWSTNTWCFEPKVGRAILEQMIASTPGVELYLRTRVTKVTSDVQAGKTMVTGIEAIEQGGAQPQPYVFHSKIVIDATEWGDVLALSPAQYRAGNSISPNVNPSACLQDCTWTAVIRKYPAQVPATLVFPGEPPGYTADVKAHFESIVTNNGADWISGPNDYPASWNTHSGYRGMPDSASPGSYDSTKPQLISRTGVNWANDYPVTVEALDPAKRQEVFCAARLRTLQFLYYAQHDLGKTQWSVADDEGFDTPFQDGENLCPNIPAAFKPIEKQLPVMPYVREARRLVGVKTLTAGEIRREPPCVGCPPRAVKTFPTALAVGDYAVDLHGCNTNAHLELALESEADVPPGFKSGAFQVPFEVFIPQSVDGLLVAERNLSVSRLVNGAIRLQPITMLTGQAAGAIAALAIERGLQPRNLHPAIVQDTLVDEGCLLEVWPFADVPRSHPHWDDIQFISGREIMTGFDEYTFSPDTPLTRIQGAVVIVRTFDVPMGNPPAVPTFQDVPKSHWGYPYVEALYAAGLTTGCSAQPKLFCPDDPMNRAAAAKFLVDGLGYDPASAPAQFVFQDLPANHWALPWAQWAVSLGILPPCTPGKFCPDAGLVRWEMAEAVRKTVLLKVDP